MFARCDNQVGHFSLVGYFCWTFQLTTSFLFGREELSSQYETQVGIFLSFGYLGWAFQRRKTFRQEFSTVQAIQVLGLRHFSAVGNLNWNFQLGKKCKLGRSLGELLKDARYFIRKFGMIWYYILAGDFVNPFGQEIQLGSRFGKEIWEGDSVRRYRYGCEEGHSGRKSELDIPGKKLRTASW